MTPVVLLMPKICEIGSTRTNVIKVRVNPLQAECKDRIRAILTIQSLGRLRLRDAKHAFEGLYHNNSVTLRVESRDEAQQLANELNLLGLSTDIL